AEIEGVRHLEGVEEDVDLPAARAVVEQPPGPMRGVEHPLRLEARLLQQGAQRPRLPFVRHQVDVRVVTAQECPGGGRAADPDRDAAEQADRDGPSRGPGHDRAARGHHRRLTLVGAFTHSGGISANVWVSCMPWLRRYSRTPMYQTTPISGAVKASSIGLNPNVPPNPVWNAT